MMKKQKAIKEPTAIIRMTLAESQTVLAYLNRTARFPSVRYPFGVGSQLHVNILKLQAERSKRGLR